MSTNKATENPSTDQHYRSDALIATGATVSVLILGGVLQFISPKVTPEKMATPAEESQPAVTYSTSLSTGSEDANSLEMTTSEIALTTENLSATSTQMTETATAAPEATAPGTTMADTESTITDPATLQALNSQVLSKIDENWTTNPTFTSSLVYQINVTESGAIASYKEINESAKNYSNETPLPSLIDPAATSDKTAKFVVVFTPSGQLEVSPWISGN
jgi:hypothetical protein